MKRVVSILLSGLLLLLTLAGCGGQNPKPETVRDLSKLNLGAVTPDESFTLNSENVYYFTLSDTGEIFAVTDQRKLAEFNRNGELIEEYPNAGNLAAIQYHNGNIYAYDADLDKLVVYDLQEKTGSAVSDAFELDIVEIKNLYIVDDTALLLLVPEWTHEAEEGTDGHEQPYPKEYDNGYMDFGERLYTVSLAEGSVRDTGLDHLVALYKDTAGTLYCYAYNDKDKAYELYPLDPAAMKKGKGINPKGADYLYAFVYENENFSFVSGGGLHNSTPRMDLPVLLKDGVRTGLGCNIALYAGHFVYRTLPGLGTDGEVIEPSVVTSVYIGHIYEKEAGSDAKPNTSLTISAQHQYTPINKDYMYKQTGLLTIAAQSSIDENMLMEFMSNSEQADIYFIDATTLPAWMRNTGYYVPMQESEIISAYVEGCFDALAEECYAAGELWAFPVSADSYAITYSPENLALAGLGYEDFATFDSFLGTLERYGQETGDFLAYGSLANSFGGMAKSYYDAYHNDFERKVVDYNTDLFRHIFKTMWTGWNRSLGYDKEGGNHPLFRDSFIDVTFETSENGMPVAIHPEYDKEKLLFKCADIWENVTDAPNWTMTPDAFPDYSLEDWRLFPYPKISEKVTGNLVWSTFAVINPNSKHKEQALAYLEAIAANPHEALEYICFTQKDPAFYEGVYDMNLPFFQDAYDIMANATFRKVYSGGSSGYIDDYQAGRLTLDEAIASLQREAEMWLGE